jgi:hypothetical protein
LLRLGKNGEPGVKVALGALSEAFTNKVGPDRTGGKAEARREFNEFIYRKSGNRWEIRPDVAALLAKTEYDFRGQPCGTARIFNDQHSRPVAGPSGRRRPARRGSPCG